MYSLQVLVKAWAHVLACKATGVTFDKPLDTPLFAFYYKAAPGATVQPPGDDGPSQVSGNTGTAAIAPTTTQGTSFPPTAMAPDIGNMLLVCLRQMQMQMLQTMQGDLGGSLVLPSQVIGPVAGHPIASHDLSDVMINGNKEYPLINTLFEELKCKYPRRNLGILLQKLTDGGMRTIDEFTLWSENELVGTFKVSAGEAQWVLKEVKNVLKMLQEI
ncbi:hypothetical protein K439DRAFT_1625234 [Ramaria rubella]|nr:hypothetical protein K439DRAFT_1625234 [Ramaria rubella]